MELDKSLAEIAGLVGGRVIGDGNIHIKGVNGIKEAQEGDLTFLANSKYIALAKKTSASAVLVASEADLSDRNLIVVDNPSFAFAQVINNILKTDDYKARGIHETALVAKDATIGKNVSLGPYVVVESKASIGENTVIEAGTFVGHESVIGEDCHLYPNVAILERINIGNRVVIHSGTVVGSDGFGFEEIDGIHEKIPQIGTVLIEDDVELGANVTVDRARFNKTVIGKGTKVDNLVQIAHNVIIGENCIIVAQVGISGSVEIKDRAILAGQAGVAGHLTIGEGAIIAAQSGVTKSIPANTKVSGYPALAHDEAKKLHASLKRLPNYIKTIKELSARIEALEKKNNG